MKRFWSNVVCGIAMILIVLFCVDLAKERIILETIIKYYDVITSIVVIIGIFLFVIGIILRRRFQKLLKNPTSFAEEDIISEKKDRLFADVTLCFKLSQVCFLFAVATGFILLRDTSPTVVFVALCLLGLTFILTKVFVHDLAIKIHPDRKFPETEEDVLEALDDGEKYIVLQAYDKVFRLINPFLFVGIMIASIYSAFTGESQIFSILFMTALLIVIDTVYIVNVRNK